MSWIKYTILLFALQAKLLEAVSVDMSEAEYAQYLEFANSQLDSYDTNECGNDDSGIVFDQTWTLVETEVGNGTVLNQYSDLWNSSENGVLTFKMNTTMNNCSTLQCYNTIGSFYCACKSGYTGTVNCIDIDECNAGSHDCGAVPCVNTEGSYRCQCNSGFTGNESCVDIDECATNDHNCTSPLQCFNSEGSFNCSCNHGYDNSNNCSDVDECATSTHNCSSSANCTNMNGSFSCTCLDGYSGDGYMCISCNATVACVADATCEFIGNTSSSQCTCNEGFLGMGTSFCTNTTTDRSRKEEDYMRIWGFRLLLTDFTYSSTLQLFVTDYVAAVSMTETDNDMKNFYIKYLQIQDEFATACVMNNIVTSKDDVLIRPRRITKGSIVTDNSVGVTNGTSNDTEAFQNVTQSVASALNSTTSDYDECLYNDHNCTGEEVCINDDNFYTCIPMCPTCCSESTINGNFSLTNVTTWYNSSDDSYYVNCDDIQTAFLEELKLGHNTIFDAYSGTVRVCDIQVSSMSIYVSISGNDVMVQCGNISSGGDLKDILVAAALKYNGSGVVNTTYATQALSTSLGDGWLQSFTDGNIKFMANSTDVLFTDIDECSTSMSNCDSNAYCNNTEGSYTCTCQTSPITYYGDGTTCSKATKLECTPTSISFLILEEFALNANLLMNAIHFGNETYATTLCRTGQEVMEGGIKYWKFTSPDDFSSCGGLSKKEGLTLTVTVVISNKLENSNISAVGPSLYEELKCEFSTGSVTINLTDPYTSVSSSEVEINLPAEQGGILQVSLNIYKHDNFTVPYTGAIQLSRNQFLPIGVSLNTKASNIYIAVKNFWGSPSLNSNDPKKYYLISDYCQRIGMVEIVEQGTSTQAKFKFLAFNFNNEAAFYLFIETDITSDPIAIQCPTSNRRKRSTRVSRSVLLTYQYQISSSEVSASAKPTKTLAATTRKISGTASSSPAIETTTTVNSNNAPNTDNPVAVVEYWIWIVAAALGVILLGIAVTIAILLIRKKKKEKECTKKDIMAMNEHIKTLHYTM